MVRSSDSCNFHQEDMTSTPLLRPTQTVNNTGTWSLDEDERLKKAVAKHNTRWVAVAVEVGTRNGEQCAKRWNDKVNPDLHHGLWSAEEDKLLLHLVTLYGHNWKFMTDNFLQSRASLSIKNRYSLLMRRQRRQNTKLQQQQQQQQQRQRQRSSAASHGNKLPSSTNTSSWSSSSSPNAHRSPCNLNPIAVNSGSSSNSPFSNGDQTLAVSGSSGRSSTNLVPSSQTDINSNALGTANCTVDLSEFFSNNVPNTSAVQGDNGQGIETQFILSGAEAGGVGAGGSSRHSFDNDHHCQDQDAAYTEWEWHYICSNNVDFSDLLGNAGLSISSPAAPGNGTLESQQQELLPPEFAENDDDYNNTNKKMNVDLSPSLKIEGYGVSCL